MFCKMCGKEISDGQELCDECAAKSTNTVNSETTSESNSGAQNVNQNTTNTNAQNATVINNNQANVNPQAKSKLVAGLLGIFLGTFGVHNFYLGFHGKAIAQLLITILSCFTLFWVPYIWGLIEGIMILCGNIQTDANGIPLKD